MKIKYKQSNFGHCKTECPFRHDVSVGSSMCELCSDFIAKNIEFVVCSRNGDINTSDVLPKHQIAKLRQETQRIVDISTNALGRICNISDRCNNKEVIELTKEYLELNMKAGEVYDKIQKLK